MVINYTVRADVIDIQRDNPRSRDIFLVDTNVWYWLAYTRASEGDRPPSSYQIRNYPAYIGRARTARSQLFYSGLSFAELAHLIEKTEREIFSRRAGGGIDPKPYRHNYSNERSNQVIPEIETAWSIVTTIAKPLRTVVDETTTNAAIIRAASQALDGYDLFILEAMSAAGIRQVITDDGDFVTVPNIQVFTANRGVITAARAQNRLIER